ncbi:MAG: PAS domain S-box protein [Firmicutes bacterium]|nr:PAS domain S-box protein [Bacillota bacterium]
MSEIRYLIEEKQRLEHIIRATNIGTWEWFINTGHVVYNETWANLIGYALDEIQPTIDTWINLAHPEDFKASEEILKRVFSKELPFYEAEVRIKHKNGNWIWVLDKGEVISWDIDGKPLVMVGSHIDVTQIKQVNEKLEELLNIETQSEMLLRSSVESAKDMIILAIDKNYDYLYFNKKHKEAMALAYGVDIKPGMNLLKCITSKDDIIKSKKNYDLALTGVSHTTIETYGNQQVSFYESQYNPIYNDQKEIIGTTAFAKDISDLIGAINQAHESEEKLKLVLNSTTSGIYSVDNHDLCTYVNRSTLQLLGYDNEKEFLGKKIHNLIHHSHSDGSPCLPKDCFLIKSFNCGIDVNQDDIVWKKDGTYFPVTYTSTPQIKDGIKIGTVVTFRDISQTTKLINDLTVEHAKSQKYLDVAGVMLLVLDSNENISLINHKGCDILEAHEIDIVGKNWFENYIPKANLKSMTSLFEDIFNKSTEQIIHYENDIITANGNKKTISWYNTILYDNDHVVSGVLCSGEDITIKKNNEIALNESNLRFQNLFNKAPIGYLSLDINGLIREANQTWLDMLGYDKNEVIGTWFGVYLPDEEKPHFISRFEVFKKQGKIKSQTEIYHKDGHKLIIEFNGMIGYDENNHFVQTYGTFIDITDRITTEDKLLASEKNLKSAQSIAKVGSWELDLKNNFIWASEEAFNIYELEHNSEFIGLDIIQKMVDSADRDRMNRALKDLLYKNKPYDVTFRLHTKNKNVKYINSKALLYRDQESNPIKITGAIHDITELKNKELELEYLSQRDYLTGLYNRRYYFDQFNKLNSSKYYPLGVIMIDVNGLKIINDAFGHTVGDLAIKIIGDVLKYTFEEKDVISRIGGDEFTVLLPNTSAEKLQEYKERVITTIKTKSVENIELSVAIGYELKYKKSEDIDDIQKLAENRMYRHKIIEGSSVRSNAINAILLTLTDKYETERKHSNEVSRLCKLIGVELHLRDDEIKELEQAGLFHDIGKISIPDSILNKPGRLTPEEFEIIKSHTEIGYQILRAADEYSDLAIHALHHHERWDGEGYPSGLIGNEIPLFSRIICVVDAYEAMTADRPYRNKLSKEYAIEEITRCTGSQFDPEIAKIFIEKIVQKQSINQSS